MSKKSPVRAVLFDWDNTLLNSYPADTHAYLAMFGALGIPWGVEELKTHYTPDWYRLYRTAKLPRSRWEEANRLWRCFYRRQKPALLPGARQVLRELRKEFLLAVVTSGSRARVRRQLAGFGLTGWFAALICSEDAHRRKPHPAPLRAVLRRLSLRPEECVYVGDAPEDMEMAQRAGVRAIAVLGPYPTHERLRAAGPDAVLASIRELPHALRRY